MLPPPQFKEKIPLFVPSVKLPNICRIFLKIWTICSTTLHLRTVGYYKVSQSGGKPHQLRTASWSYDNWHTVYVLLGTSKFFHPGKNLNWILSRYLITEFIHSYRRNQLRHRSSRENIAPGRDNERFSLLLMFCVLTNMVCASWCTVQKCVGWGDIMQNERALCYYICSRINCWVDITM